MHEHETERTAIRTRMVGGISAQNVGETLRLAGWVHRRRNLGGLLFVDLRDRSGLLQVSFGPDWTDADGMTLSSELGAEDVISVEGRVERRPDPNPQMATGEVELRAVRLERLSRAKTPAIPVYRGPEEELPSEELRLRHRVLDLRRPELQRALTLRHKLILAVRNTMDGMGFVEVETPILTKPTPEGARDYLVPSRVHHGEFYALPQSPQIYKQILMVAGFDRYFQIARCFRDEDLRADRQPEFTQIDLEASFITPEDILRWVEGLTAAMAARRRRGGARSLPAHDVGRGDGPLRLRPAGPPLRPRDPRLDRRHGRRGLPHPALRGGGRRAGTRHRRAGRGAAVPQGHRGGGGGGEGRGRARAGVGEAHRGRRVRTTGEVPRRGPPGGDGRRGRRPRARGGGRRSRDVARALRDARGRRARGRRRARAEARLALGPGLPALRGGGGGRADAWAPPLRDAAPGRHGAPRQRPREGARPGVRPRVQRDRVRLGEPAHARARAPTARPAPPGDGRRRDRPQVRVPPRGALRRRAAARRHRARHGPHRPALRGGAGACGT